MNRLNGSMNGLYTPPPSSLVRYVGATPLVEHSALAIDSEDVYSTLKMPYRISDDAQGNVTIEVIQFQNLTGNPFLPTEGNALTGHYNINSNGQQNVPFIDLAYIPKIGSVKVLYGLEEYNEIPGNPGMSEFYVDYINGNINFTKNFTGDIAYIEYIPKWVTVNPSNANHLDFIHNKVFENYQGQIDNEAHAN